MSTGGGTVNLSSAIGCVPDESVSFRTKMFIFKRFCAILRLAKVAGETVNIDVHNSKSCIATVADAVVGDLKRSLSTAEKLLEQSNLDLNAWSRGGANVHTFLVMSEICTL